jgi:putative oxidoreductase
MVAMMEGRAATALLILRVSLGVFLLQWSVEKIVVPESAMRFAEHLYALAPAIGTTIMVGVAEGLLALALLVGVWRRWSYGLAIVVDAVSVAATWRQLLNPYAGTNHLFIAGVPVLAAFILLYVLRAWDAYSVEGWRERGTIVARQ